MILIECFQFFEWMFVDFHWIISIFFLFLTKCFQIFDWILIDFWLNISCFFLLNNCGFLIEWLRICWWMFVYLVPLDHRRLRPPPRRQSPARGQRSSPHPSTKEGGVVWHSGNALAYSSWDRAVKTAPICSDPTNSPYAYLLIVSREAFICVMP